MNNCESCAGIIDDFDLELLMTRIGGRHITEVSNCESSAGIIDDFALELLITPIGGQHIYEVACLKVLSLIDIYGLNLDLTMV